MMNLKLLLITVFVIIIGGGFLVLRAAGSTSARFDDQKSSPNSIAGEATTVFIATPADTEASISSTATRSKANVKPLQDGQFILEERCKGCHMVQSLERTKKSRAQWEKALAKMEGFGVQLNDSEKTALLDHLAVFDNP